MLVEPDKPLCELTPEDVPGAPREPSKLLLASDPVVADFVGVSDGTEKDNTCGNAPAVVTEVVVFVGVCWLALLAEVAAEDASVLGVDNRPIVGLISPGWTAGVAAVVVDPALVFRVGTVEVKFNPVLGWVAVDAVDVLVSAGLELKLKVEVPKLSPGLGAEVAGVAENEGVDKVLAEGLEEEAGVVGAVVLLVVVLVDGPVVVPVEVPKSELVPVANPLKLGKVTDDVGLFGLRKDKEDEDDIDGLASFKLLAKLTLPLNVDLVDDWLKFVERDDCGACVPVKLNPPKEFVDVAGAAEAEVVVAEGAAAEDAVFKLNPLLVGALVLDKFVENKPPDDDDGAVPPPLNGVADPKPKPVDVVETAEPNKDFWTPSDGWFCWIELERLPPKGVEPNVKLLLLEDGVVSEKPLNDVVAGAAADVVDDCPKMLWLGGLAVAAGATAADGFVEPNEKAGLLAVVELAPKLSPPDEGAAVVLVENKPPDCGAVVVGFVEVEPNPKPELELDNVGAAAAGVVDENDVLPKLNPDVEAGAAAVWLEFEERPKRLVPVATGFAADEPNRPPDVVAVGADEAVAAEFPKLNDELIPPAVLDAGCCVEEPNENGVAAPVWPVFDAVPVVPGPGVDVNENENGLLLFDPNIFNFLIWNFVSY